jgi:hypothetical protein
MQGSKRSLWRVSVIFAITLVALLTSSPTGAQTSSTYKMQQVSPPPSYVDTVQGGGTFVGAGIDDYFTTQLPEGFDFTFFGTLYPGGSTIYVSTNGYINFKAPPPTVVIGGYSYQLDNTCPITTAEPNAAIYAFWDYLAAQVWTQVLGEKPNRQFIIEFSNVTLYTKLKPEDPDPSYLPASAFEIVLFETTGAIEFRYQNVPTYPGDQDLPKGKSATIGIENDNGSSSFQWSCSPSPDPTKFSPIGPGPYAIRFDPVTESDEDDPPPTNTTHVEVDIKPKHVLNWFNVARQGRLSVAILGKAGFDVKQIDPKSVRLAGVAPLYSWVENVRTQESHGWRRVFHRFGGRDRRLDLILKFDRRAIVAALDSVNHGDVNILKLTGRLKDGTEFSGQDSIKIINKAKKKKNDSYHDSWRNTPRHNDDDDDHDEDDE